MLRNVLGTALQAAANRPAVDKFNVFEISGNQNIDNVRNGIHYYFASDWGVIFFWTILISFIDNFYRCQIIRCILEQNVLYCTVHVIRQD